jgi:hypothetical protein
MKPRSPSADTNFFGARELVVSLVKEPARDEDVQVVFVGQRVAPEPHGGPTMGDSGAGRRR